MLSSDDPVRVYQQYATLDLLSGGRAEIMAGRGSFIESFPLFGYDMAHYEALFEEKLQLFAELLKPSPATPLGPWPVVVAVFIGTWAAPLAVLRWRGWSCASASTR